MTTTTPGTTPAAGIGGGLTFAGVSNTCAMGTLPSRPPYNRTAAGDPDGLVAQLGTVEN